MSTLTIKLKIKGKVKKFKAPGTISADLAKKTLRTETDIDNYQKTGKPSLEVIIDQCAHIVSGVFDYQFTPEQLLKAMSYDKLIHFTDKCMLYLYHEMRIKREGKSIPYNVIDIKTKQRM